MKYLIASDYDGTLCQNGVISTETIEAIKKFRSMGHLFGVVTGRTYVTGFERFKINNTFPFDFVIVSNGASAYDKDGNAYFTEYINGSKAYGESTLVQELIKRCFELNAVRCSISFDKSWFKFSPQYPSGGEVDSIEYSPLSFLENVGDFVSACVTCENPEEASRVTRILKDEFGEFLTSLQNHHVIDISSVGVTKATGIAHLAECLGISNECIWTAGDNHNDMAMLEKFHGCGMSSGLEDVRNAAEYVCDSVADVIKLVLER